MLSVNPNVSFAAKSPPRRSSVARPTAKPLVKPLLRDVLADLPLVRDISPGMWNDRDAALGYVLKSLEELQSMDDAFLEFLKVVARCNITGTGGEALISEVVFNTVTSIMQDAPRVDFSQRTARATAATETGQLMSVTGQTAKLVVQRFLHGLLELEARGIVGRHQQILGTDAVKAEHGRTVLSGRLVKSTTSTETTEKGTRRGIWVNRRNLRQTVTTCRVLDTTLTHERHVQVLWHPVVQGIRADVAMPDRVAALIAGIPGELTSLAKVFTADTFAESVTALSTRNVRTTEVATATSWLIERSLNWETFARIGSMAASVARAAGSFAISALDGLARVDPFVALGEFVLCGWVPQECER